MISSYFKIEILAIRDEFVKQGHKGLLVRKDYETHFKVHFAEFEPDFSG